MSKIIKKQGKNWSINIEITDGLIFAFGMLAGMIVGKL